jgi:hypothetical protein
MNLYQSKVQFFELTHTYKNEEGKYLLGITSLMKKHGLSCDYSNVPADVLKNAALRGGAIHGMIEDYDNGKETIQTPELKAYISMKKKYNFSIECSEYLVTDEVMVASKIDKVLSDGSLADIKTTAQLHISDLEWQLSFYAYLFEKMNPDIKVPHLYAFHIRGTEYKMVEITRKPTSVIEEVFECERNGKIYTPQNSNSDNSLLDVLDEKDSKLFIDNELQYAKLQAAIKAAESYRKDFSQKIIDKMLANNLNKIESDLVTISLVKPSKRVSIDSKMLKEYFPEAAEKCKKEIDVAGSLRITLKTN